MKILDGKKISQKILSGLKEEIKNKRMRLNVAVILAGKDPASEMFIRQKEKACLFAGIGFQVFGFPSSITHKELKGQAEEIAGRAEHSGIIVQLPLPKKFNSREILNLIPPEKDIDVLSERNLGKFYSGTLPIMPPAVAGISRILEEYKIPLLKKEMVLVGAGELVGLPLALWFLREGATVSVVNRSTKDISVFTKRADILISGAGRAKLITGEMIRKGAVVIDAGTSFAGGKMKGDVDFESCSRKASFITPVPGGVGPMTVACLLENLVKINT